MPLPPAHRSGLTSHIQDLFDTFALTQHLPNQVTDAAARQNLLANPWRRSQAFKEGTDMGQDTSRKKAPGWRKSSLITGNRGLQQIQYHLLRGSSPAVLQNFLQQAAMP